MHGKRALIGGFFLVLSICNSVLSEVDHLSPEMDIHAWPFTVNWEDGFQKKTQFLGPLFETFDSSLGSHKAIRPFYLERTYSEEEPMLKSQSFLYPLFIHREYEGHQQSSILSLIRWKTIDTDTDLNIETDPVKHYLKAFEVFPFYFDYDSWNLDYDYFGVFPIYGELKNRLFYDRISWVGFPFYSKWEDNDETTYAYLWPFIKYRTGPTSEGFGVWPLYGNFKKENTYHRRYAIWPFLYYNQEKMYLDTPITQMGVLPFYAKETRENYKREDYLWPFFGYTKQVDPTYDELRLLWPVFIQGRGEMKYLNQFAPIYSISKRPDRRSYWYLWPLFNYKVNELDSIDVRTFKLLYFLYKDTTQTISGRPDEMLATKKHLWPLYSYWENKEGQKQLQVLSILEPLFPNNDEIRKKYTPLFSIYRYSELAENHKDVEILFSLIQFERRPTYERLEIGPLFGYEYGEEKKRIELLKGLLGYRNENKKRSLRLLWVPIGLGKSDDN